MPTLFYFYYRMDKKVRRNYIVANFKNFKLCIQFISYIKKINILSNNTTNLIIITSPCILFIYIYIYIYFINFIKAMHIKIYPQHFVIKRLNGYCTIVLNIIFAKNSQASAK